MTIFADASALIAIIAHEPDALVLADCLQDDRDRLCSAKLNMGDCYAYACARTHGARLLFKGEDFTLTDVTPARGNTAV